jgi:hypothetical protein
LTLLSDISGLLIIVGSLFGWASGAGERRGQHTKDTETTIAYQENKCSLLMQEKILMENNDKNSAESKELHSDQKSISYDEESDNESSETRKSQELKALDIYS